MIQIRKLAVAATVLAACAPATMLLGSTIALDAPPSLAAWSARVYGDLSRRLDYPQDRSGQIGTGVVAVKFNCSESGAPADVSLYKSSGSRDLDRATLWAMRHVATLHPLPAGMRHDQHYVVRVLFADSEENGARQMRQIRAEAEKSNAWFARRAPATASVVELLPPVG